MHICIYVYVFNNLKYKNTYMYILHVFICIRIGIKIERIAAVLLKSTYLSTLDIFIECALFYATQH